jgi:hypothetical protein
MMVEAAGVELSKTPFFPRACQPFRWFTSRSVPLDPAEIRPVWQRRGSASTGRPNEALNLTIRKAKPGRADSGAGRST